MIRPYPAPIIEDELEPIDPFEIWPDLPRHADDDVVDDTPLRLHKLYELPASAIRKPGRRSRRHASRMR